MRKLVLTTISVTSLALLAACGGSQEADGDSSSGPTPAVVETPEVEVAFADLTGDAAAGEGVFAACSACHQLTEGTNVVGPSLYGIVGRQAGTVEGFNYSTANAEADVVWTPEALFDYLENPRAFILGTRMSYPGLRDAQQRADLIAFLETQGG